MIKSRFRDRVLEKSVASAGRATINGEMQRVLRNRKTCFIAGIMCEPKTSAYSRTVALANKCVKLAGVHYRVDKHPGIDRKLSQVHVCTVGDLDEVPRPVEAEGLSHLAGGEAGVAGEDAVVDAYDVVGVAVTGPTSSPSQRGAPPGREEA